MLNCMLDAFILSKREWKLHPRSNQLHGLNQRFRKAFLLEFEAVKKIKMFILTGEQLRFSVVYV